MKICIDGGAKAALQEWRKFHRADNTLFDICMDGPNGHGVRGKAIGCAPFFQRLKSPNLDMLQVCGELLDQHVREKQNFEQERYSTTLNRMNELLNVLVHASNNPE